MFLTSEGALLAVALATLAGGLIAAWALLCLSVRRPDSAPRRKVSKPGQARRVVVPAGTAPKV
jgi:hypothetical protein